MWEYKVELGLKCPRPGETYSATLERHLNGLGAEHWELVSISNIEGFEEGPWFFFKRPLAKPS